MGLIQKVKELHQKGILLARVRRRLVREVRSAVWPIRCWFWRELRFKVHEAHLRLPSSDQLAYELYVNNFEEAERVFVSHFLFPGDIFVDVGANVGVFTVIGARRVGPEGQVHAFEPAEEAYRWLVKNINLNRLKNVHLNRCGLSDKVETRPLTVCGDRYLAWSSFGSPVSLAREGSLASEMVQCTTLDLYAQSVGLRRIDLLKLDVEGWEEHVLAGAVELLSAPQAPVCLVEFCEEALQGAGSSCVALRQRLESLGFSLYRFTVLPLSFIPEPEGMSYVYENLIATKNPAEVLNRLRASGLSLPDLGLGES